MIFCSVISVEAFSFSRTDSIDFSVSEFNFETREETNREFANDELRSVKNTLRLKNNNFITLSDYPSKPFNDISLTNGDNDFIIENDQRILVNNTETSPYSSIVYLQISWGIGEDKTRATGFLVSDNVVITAAHALYDPTRGGWADSVKVYPGKDGDGLFDNPYGSTRAYKGGVCTEWRAATDSGLKDDETKQLLRETDWGAVVLIRSLGKKTGVLNMRIPTDNDLNTLSSVMVSGYPKKVNNTEVFQQYKMSGSIRKFNSLEIYYNLQTSGGQSGAPILDSNNVAIGIHTRSWGDTETNKHLYGSGVRFTEHIMYYLNQTINENA